MYLLNSHKHKKLAEKIDIYKYKAIIFDVDGTLNHLNKMYRRVRTEIIKYYFYHPREIEDIKIITGFMNEREKHALDVVDDVENSQYEWAASKYEI